MVIIFEHLNNICINFKYKLNIYVSFLPFAVLKVCFEQVLSRYEMFLSLQIISLVSSMA